MLLLKFIAILLFSGEIITTSLTSKAGGGERGVHMFVSRGIQADEFKGSFSFINTESVS